MDCAFLVHEIYGYYRKAVHAQLRQLDDIFDGGNTIAHENVHIRKINLQNMLEITEI